MNSGAFGEGFPYTNFHDLNMDWVVKIAKDFLDQYTHLQQTIENGEQSLQDKADELEALLQAWYDTHSEDIANQLVAALASLDQELTDNIAAFDQAAADRLALILASIPSDYSAMYSLLQAEIADINRDNGYAAYPRNMIISSSNKWTTTGNGNHVLIPIYPGDNIYIKANGSYNAVYGVLRDYTTPVADESPLFSTYTGFTTRLTITTPQSVTFTAPADAKYLYITNIANANINLPNAVTVNGKNMFLGVREYIESVEDKLDKYETLPTNTDLNTVLGNGMYLLTSDSTYSNKPSGYTGTAGFLKVYFVSNWCKQILYSFSYGETFTRRGNANGTTWTDWVRVDADDPTIFRVKGILANNTDLNSITTGTWLIASGGGYTHLPSDWGVKAGFIQSYVVSSPWVIQFIYTLQGGTIYKRQGNTSTGTWEDWTGLIPDAKTLRVQGSAPTNASVNGLATGIWMIESSGGYSDLPLGWGSGAGFMEVWDFSPWIIQIAYKFTGSEVYKRRGNRNTNTWEDWNAIAGNTYLSNNTYNFSEYSQTLTVNATPNITSDTNNYLPSTGDQTDRTADILAMLQSNGVCHLGKGGYFIQNLQMPDNTSLIGSGFGTILRVIDGADTYGVKLGTRCHISNLKIVGASATPTLDGNILNRHGILWQGTFTSNNLGPTSSFIDHVWVYNFTGGGITCYDTGTPSTNGMMVSDTYIYNCNVGLNIAYLSEYSKFCNIKSYNNYYGCINNGGNNIFVNCDFSSNLDTAFLIDNTNSQSPNNSHGSCSNCMFNHTARNGTANSGTGIKIINSHEGFIFEGCQIFFSKTEITNSAGIVFSNCNYGQNNCNIIINGEGVILFANNMHGGAPTIAITNNTKTKFVNCYNRTNGNLISA